eukprot:s1459_g7.t1
MLPDDSPQVQAELARRIAVRAKAEGKVDDDPNAGTVIKAKGSKVGKQKKDKSAVSEGLDLASGGKWQQAHQQLAESRVPKDLQQNEWFQTLSLREREALGKAPVAYGDLYHSASRTPSSTAKVQFNCVPGSTDSDRLVRLLRNETQWAVVPSGRQAHWEGMGRLLVDGSPGNDFLVMVRLLWQGAEGSWLQL